MDKLSKLFASASKKNTKVKLSVNEIAELNKLSESDGTYESDNEILKAVIKILGVTYARRYMNWTTECVNIKFYGAEKTQSLNLALSIVLPNARVLQCKENGYPSMSGTSVYLPYKKVRAGWPNLITIVPTGVNLNN